MGGTSPAGLRAFIDSSLNVMWTSSFGNFDMDLNVQATRSKFSSTVRQFYKEFLQRKAPQASALLEAQVHIWTVEKN